MSGDVGAIVGSATAALGYELVEFERSARGLLRVFIDKPGGISVDDCAALSNHLTRVFAVEGIDFDRLEVSSPGLDRALSRPADFQRFQGQAARVRLSEMIDGRKRFDGTIVAVEDDAIRFALIENDRSTLAKAKTGAGKRTRKASAPAVAEEVRMLVVPLAAIERARLIPDV